VSQPDDSRDQPHPLALAFDGPLFLRRVFVGLLLAELVIVCLDVVVTYYEAIAHHAVQDLCNMVIENSLSNWFSSVQALVVGLVLFLVGARVAGEAGSSSRARAAAWAVVASFFVFLALDDGTGFHEAMGTWLEDTRGLGGFPSYAWQILFVPLWGAWALFVLFWSRREMTRRGFTLVLLGVACFVISVGIDFVEGMETPYEALTLRFSLHEDTIPHFSGVLEEFIEMLGTTLLLRAYLSHLLGLLGDVRVRVEGAFLRNGQGFRAGTDGSVR